MWPSATVQHKLFLEVLPLYLRNKIIKRLLSLGHSLGNQSPSPDYLVLRVRKLIFFFSHVKFN